MKNMLLIDICNCSKNRSAGPISVYLYPFVLVCMVDIECMYLLTNREVICAVYLAVCTLHSMSVVVKYLIDGWID